MRSTTPQPCGIAIHGNGGVDAVDQALDELGHATPQFAEATYQHVLRGMQMTATCSPHLGSGAEALSVDAIASISTFISGKARRSTPARLALGCATPKSASA